MRIVRIILTALLLAAPLAGIAKDKNKEFQFQVVGAYPLGVGVSLGYHLNDYLYLGGEYFQYKTTITGKSDSTSDAAKNPEGDISLKTGQIFLRISPFGGSFFIQGGFVQRDWDALIKAEEEIGDTGIIAQYEADIEWPNTATNVAMGFNWATNSGFSIGLGVGGILGGKPRLTDIRIINSANNFTEEQKQAEIDKVEEENEDTFNRLRNIPYAYLALGWNF